jgi:competence protein ComEA
MNKKYITIGIMFGFLLISGFCYSCTFHGKDTTKALTADLSEDAGSKNQSVNQGGNNKITQEPAAITGSNTGEQKAVQDKEAGISVTGVPDDQTQEVPGVKLFVHLCGAVEKPGVYEAETKSRLCDLIKLAGGLKENAAGDYINQARLVTDGERIYIPTKREVEEITAGDYVEGDQSGKSPDAPKASKDTVQSMELVDINLASAEELMKLPGIGQAKADSIIKYRSENGKFQKIEDLMNISGIKEGLFNKISSCITVK